MISSLIRRVMQECGLTQKALADVLDVGVDRVKSITTGKVQKLTREESEALVKKLNIRAEWLVTGQDPMFQTAQEKEFQRRLDTVAQATRQAVAAGLTAEQADLLQRVLLAAEISDTATLAGLLVKLAPDEAALLDNYRHAPPAGKDALKATSAALAQSTCATRKKAG